MMNEHTFDEHWTELADYIRSKWGQLTAGDLQNVKGNLHELVELIHTKSGWTKENIEAELEQLATRGKQLANQGAKRRVRSPTIRATEFNKDTNKPKKLCSVDRSNRWRWPLVAV